MSEHTKRKRNLGTRGFREIAKSHVRFEPPPGRFKDLFKERETRENERSPDDVKLPKSERAAR